jgi:hypothetical protein
MSTRLSATVTSSEPDASNASSISLLELNFPVPVKRREENTLFAILSFSIDK